MVLDENGNEMPTPKIDPVNEIINILMDYMAIGYNHRFFVINDEPITNSYTYPPKTHHEPEFKNFDNHMHENRLRELAKLLKPIHSRVPKIDTIMYGLQDDRIKALEEKILRLEAIIQLSEPK